MDGKSFMNAVVQGHADILDLLLSLLEETGSIYCVIGGFAVNAYAEPVVSLDVDLVVVSDRIEEVCKAGRAKGLRIEKFEHSIDLSMAGSDLRIQIQTDPRYQDFLARAVSGRVLGYELSVAALDDVLQGKIWAYSDDRRRKSKRQKDLADILRLVETHPHLKDRVPPELASELE